MARDPGVSVADDRMSDVTDRGDVGVPPSSACARAGAAAYGARPSIAGTDASSETATAETVSTAETSATPIPTSTEPAAAAETRPPTQTPATTETAAPGEGSAASARGTAEPTALVTGDWGAIVLTAGSVRHLQGDDATVAALLARIDADRSPRWVWWSARAAVGPLVTAAPWLRLRRCWDLAAVHRLLAGGHRDGPGQVWAHVHGRPPPPPVDAPRASAHGQLDLLASGDHASPDGAGGAGPVMADGQLMPGWVPDSAARAREWAQLALEAHDLQAALLRPVTPPTTGGTSSQGASPHSASSHSTSSHGASSHSASSHSLQGGDPLHAAWAESAAELLCVELEVEGLPVDRHAVETVIASLAGRRPTDAADELAVRAERDAAVLATVPDAGPVDLRSVAQVRALLARTGLDLPDTRSWRLERLVGTHPLVAALLTWRRAERIATTYGYRWVDEHLGPDGRLRGTWTGSDGGAGRMTAQAGLHSMPRDLRVAVRAEPGHRLVRADLGQVEPRVLAAVSGDTALARAAREDDLYATVADQLRIERPVAKVAFLAAMYGQTSGSAGEALRDMQRAYPVAMAYLEDAARAGAEGRDVRTWGGRRVRMYRVEPVAPDATEAAVRAHRAAVAGRGRFARNAVVQGSAAELFKAWTATVRARLATMTPAGPQDGRDAHPTSTIGSRWAGSVVLCLHDELLLHVRTEAADGVARGVTADLESTAARWSPSGVRFVADVRVLECWADAKD